MNNFIEVSPETGFLVIDSNEAARDAIKNIIKKLGYRNCFFANDAAGAYQFLKFRKAEFIICERNLNGVSGLMLLKEIRENPQFPRLPFILMANEIPQSDVMIASEYEIDGYLKKPFMMKDVAQKITLAIKRVSNPRGKEADIEKGRLLYLKDDAEATKTYFLKLRTLYPDSTRILVYLAKSHRKLKEWSDARACLLEAIRLNPIYIHAYHELGELELETENSDNSINAFNKAIELSPNNPMRYERISELLMKESRFKEAEYFLQKAIVLELKYPDLYAQLGRVKFMQQKVNEAITYFKLALQEEPENKVFLNYMGICLKDLKKHEQAIKYYNQALKIDSEDIKILYNKVLCLCEMRDFTNAKKTCLAILRKDPDYIKAKQKLLEIESMIASHEAREGGQAHTFITTSENAE